MTRDASALPVSRTVAGKVRMPYPFPLPGQYEVWLGTFQTRRVAPNRNGIVVAQRGRSASSPSRRFIWPR